VISWFLLLIIEGPQINSLWPSSLIGLVGSLTGLIGFAVLMYEKITGKGRKLEAIDGSIKNLGLKIEALELTEKIIDTKVDSLTDIVTDLDHEVRGVQGDNGIKAAVRECRVEIQKIHELNRKHELLRERFKEIIRHYEGPERREGMRGMRELFRDSERE
jgi:hypothetical protein